MTRLACPVCPTAAWLSVDGLAAHLRQDHTNAAVARSLANLVAGLPADHSARPSVCTAIPYPTEAAAVSWLAANPPLPRPVVAPRYCTRCAAWHLKPSLPAAHERTSM